MDFIKKNLTGIAVGFFAFAGLGALLSILGVLKWGHDDSIRVLYYPLRVKSEKILTASTTADFSHFGFDDDLEIDEETLKVKINLVAVYKSGDRKRITEGSEDTETAPEEMSLQILRIGNYTIEAARGDEPWPQLPTLLRFIQDNKPKFIEFAPRKEDDDPYQNLKGHMLYKILAFKNEDEEDKPDAVLTAFFTLNPRPPGGKPPR